MPRTEPSQSEIEILQSLWERKTATVREIFCDIQVHREVGYTTTLKQVQRMMKKGLVEKVSDEGKAHIYKASVKPNRTRGQLVDRLVDAAFEGSSNALVIHALGRKKPTQKQIQEIRALLDRIEKEGS